MMPLEAIDRNLPVHVVAATIKEWTHLHNQIDLADFEHQFLLLNKLNLNTVEQNFHTNIAPMLRI
jgi:hypothetical protein